MVVLLLLAPLFLAFEVAQLVLCERYLGVKQIARGADPRTLGPGERVAMLWTLLLVAYALWTLLLAAVGATRVHGLGLLLVTAIGLATLRPRRRISMRALRVIAVMSFAGLAVVGVRNTATYPSINLTDPVRQMQAVKEPNDWVVVDPWLGFTWAAAGLSDTGISRKMDMFGWSQGYYITGDQRTIFSSNYFFPSWEYPYLQDHSHRLWYVAETGSWAWPKTDPTDKPYMTRNLADLLRRGWVQTGPVFTGDHVQVFLMEYRLTTSSAGR